MLLPIFVALHETVDADGFGDEERRELARAALDAGSKLSASFATAKVLGRGEDRGRDGHGAQV